MTEVHFHRCLDIFPDLLRGDRVRGYRLLVQKFVSALRHRPVQGCPDKEDRIFSGQGLLDIPHDIHVVCPAQSHIAAEDDRHLFIKVFLLQIRAVNARIVRNDLVDGFPQTHRIFPVGFHRCTLAEEFRVGDHLHCLCDLAGGFDRTDPGAQCLHRLHTTLPLPDGNVRVQHPCRL